MSIEYFLKFMFFSSIAIAITGNTQAETYSVISTLTAPGERNTEANGINNTGEVVGSYSNPLAYLGAHGFIYNLGSYNTIDVPGVGQAYGGTNVYGINNNGSMVGSYTYSSNMSAPTVGRGFIYDGNTYTTVDASSLNGFENTDTYAYDINDGNQIAGTLRDYTTGATRGFLYGNGALSAVNAPNAIQTTATGINNSGQVVGYFSDATTQQWHGYIYDGNSYSIFDAPNAADTFFYDINNKGQILGKYFDGESTFNFVYENGKYEIINFSNLSSSTFLLNSINDNGDLAGTAYNSGINYGFLAAPVPIPAAAWLFGSGLLAVFSAARRKSNAA